MVHDFPATRLDARDGSGEQVARHALHDIFHEEPVPCALRCPLSFFVIKELDVEGRVLEFLVGDQVCAGVVDDAMVRQFEHQSVAVEAGGDRRQRRRVDLDGTPVVDRSACGGQQPAPEHARRRVLAAPRLYDCQNLGVGATIIADDLFPRASCSAEIKCEFGILPELAFTCADVFDRTILAQDKVGEDAVQIEVLVAGLVVPPEVGQLPIFAGEPRGAPALDRRQVHAYKFTARRRAQ